jgi:hypothetical protein
MISIFSTSSNPVTDQPAQPVLDLNGPHLTSAMQSLITASEQDGGVEKYTGALELKSGLFSESLAEGKYKQLSEPTFNLLCAFMSPVRRRIGKALKEHGFGAFRDAIGLLLEDAQDTATTDERVRAFVTQFPQEKKYRWVRDMASEILHNTYPELYPLMSRWVWDANTNTGMLREIWFCTKGENIDNVVIDVQDNYATFIMLRQELSTFLSENGVYRDMIFYVDLLMSHLYGEYLSSRGSTYLRSDFTTPEDPMEYTRHMLGLNGVDTTTGRTRLKLGKGEIHSIADTHIMVDADGEA